MTRDTGPTFLFEISKHDSNPPRKQEPKSERVSANPAVFIYHVKLSQESAVDGS
jgi:hypothetical protein